MPLSTAAELQEQSIKAEEQEGRGAWIGKSARGIEEKLGTESVKNPERDGGTAETKSGLHH